MKVVHPGSLGLDVSNIVDHSLAELLTALSVGTTLFHVPVAIFIVASLPNASLTFARTGISIGSFCVPNEKLALACRQLRELHPFKLKLYGEVCNHTPASVAEVIFMLKALASVVELLLNVNVGAV